MRPTFCRAGNRDEDQARRQPGGLRIGPVPAVSDLTIQVIRRNVTIGLGNGDPLISRDSYPELGYEQNQGQARGFGSGPDTVGKTRVGGKFRMAGSRFAREYGDRDSPGGTIRYC